MKQSYNYALPLRETRGVAKKLDTENRSYRHKAPFKYCECCGLVWEWIKSSGRTPAHSEHYPILCSFQLLRETCPECEDEQV